MCDDALYGLQVFFEIYDWPPFVIALIASVVAVVVGAAFEIPMRACLRRPIQPSSLAVAEREHRLEQQQLDAFKSSEGESTPGSSMPDPC